MLTHVFTGFDSAWTDNPKRPGALASIVQDEDGRLSLMDPCLATFADAERMIVERDSLAPFHIVAIDQPLIVPNLKGRRPVERVVAHVVGKWGGGVQPANKGKTAMFGDDAGIWQLLARLPHQQAPFAAVHATRGRFVIEVFPALAVPGLFPWFACRGRVPKYNPSRRSTFRLPDWRRIVFRVELFGRDHSVGGLSAWSQELLRRKAKPTKADQDRLDAVLCAIQAREWWRNGLADSVMIGDLATGYIVAAASPLTKEILRRDAEAHGVPYCVAW